jgi:hypothetical protein
MLSKAELPDLPAQGNDYHNPAATVQVSVAGSSSREIDISQRILHY